MSAIRPAQLERGVRELEALMKVTGEPKLLLEQAVKAMLLWDNQLRKPAYLSPVLQELFEDEAEVQYKPGWMLFLHESYSDDGSGGWALHIISNTEDSINLDKRTRVNHAFLIPGASYNRDNWIAWIFERIRDVETHEAGEFFKVNGERVFAPHHGNGENPYVVWHHGTEEQRAKRAGDD